MLYSFIEVHLAVRCVYSGRYVISLALKAGKKI